MKKMKRFASAALAALLLAGSVPSALALDSTPPLYQQFGYDTADAFMKEEAWFDMLDYDAASDLYRQHLEAIHKNPQMALNQYGFETLDALDEEIKWGAWKSREDFYRSAALNMVGDDDWELRKQLTVQLNGDTIKFPDARPEKVNGRVMVPFRAIAEALGAEVGYHAGAITAKKDGETLSFALGGKQLTVTDSEGKVIRTTLLDSAPYKKSGRTYVPVRFFAEGFGLTVQWDSYYQTAVLYDRAALVDEINGEFTVLGKWIEAQDQTKSNKTMRSVATINAVYTAFDTIDGNRDYKMNVKLNILSDGKSVEATAAVDLRTLAELMIGDFVPNDLQTTAALTALKGVLSNVTVDMIYDAESGNLYLRCPALAQAMLLDTNDVNGNAADLKTLANGGWLHVNFDTLWGVMPLGALAGENRDVPYTSVGESLVAAQENRMGADGWYDWEDFWQMVQSERENLSELLGDELFTQNGSRCTAAIDIDDGYGTTTKGSYTLNTADGSISGSIENRLESGSSKTRTTAAFSGNLQSCKLKLTIQMKNEGEITLDMTLGTTESTDTPKNAPPKGSTIVEWEQEGVSNDYPDDGDSSIE